MAGKTAGNQGIPRKRIYRDHECGTKEEVSEQLQ